MEDEKCQDLTSWLILNHKVYSVDSLFKCYNDVGNFRVFGRPYPQTTELHKFSVPQYDWWSEYWTCNFLLSMHINLQSIWITTFLTPLRCPRNVILAYSYFLLHNFFFLINFKFSVIHVLDTCSDVAYLHIPLCTIQACAIYEVVTSAKAVAWKKWKNSILLWKPKLEPKAWAIFYLMIKSPTFYHLSESCLKNTVRQIHFKLTEM